MVKLIADEVQINTLDSSQQDNVQQGTVPQAIMITVYLAYAEDAQNQHYLTLSVADGTTLYAALKQAGWLTQFEGLAKWCDEVIDVAVPTAKRWHVGIYAQKQPLEYQLQPFDRIEVYRSLSADPMSQRKSKSRV
ncbi:Protein RnfH [Psychrobacter sp. SC65A.3]|uniref:RnfH family protein n=1 Tax=Psychrobacter sp. SC65A.3 TaxID=2983299 RepID=UPI0021DB76D8|nr:RnfH family protein [Psychrobacter sp. SC65A.3]WAI88778.1 Protein RnfH [Psychrobacter sp. SC65A.3]